MPLSHSLNRLIEVLVQQGNLPNLREAVTEAMWLEIRDGLDRERLGALDEIARSLIAGAVESLFRALEGSDEVQPRIH